MPFWRSYYHLVWATAERLPLLRPAAFGVVERSIRETARDQQVLIHAIGGVSDHVHVVASIPPRHAVSFVVGRMKGASARAVNVSAALPEGSKFAWQGEFGVMTFGEKALIDVCRYVNDQERRHVAGPVISELEQIADSSHG